jgi:hypothetical protein
MISSCRYDPNQIGLLATRKSDTFRHPDLRRQQQRGLSIDRSAWT